MALQLGLSLLGFVYQDKQGPISNSDTTQCVDPRRVFMCSLLHPVGAHEWAACTVAAGEAQD